MSPFGLTKAAYADLKAIARFTEDRWGSQQRTAYLKDVDGIFWALAKNPLMGRACDEVRKGYRKYSHGSHVIFYKLVGENELLVVRVLHMMMDADTNLGA